MPGCRQGATGGLVARWSPEIEDRIRRSDFAGQMSIDGDQVAEFALRPRTQGQLESADRIATEQAEEAGAQELLLFDE